ncbi:MAG: hypothetical protein [Myoviridae sp. ctThM1]|nr:MAG: hypothetical protein [Myoviridae sp. ctThM1]
MKSNMCLKVELLAGTSLEDALKEAKDKAVLFNLAYVEFDFNGIGFSVRQNGDIEEALEKYKEPGVFKHIVC